MTVKAIVRQYLSDHGFEGLVADMGECSCELDDLMPCECTGVDRCEPGYKIPCPGDECEYGGDCDWHISINKPGNRDAENTSD